MRVLIADKFEQSGRDGLEAAGCDYSYQPDVKDDIGWGHAVAAALVNAALTYGAASWFARRRR